MLRILDGLAYSSVWVGLAAGALCAAAARAMGAPVSMAAVVVAATGTIFVYNVDRIRDLEKDRATSPLRSAFVAAEQRQLTILAVASGVVAALVATQLGARALWVLVPVLAIGLAHRRLKRLVFVKSIYVALAWVAVVVGLPASTAPSFSDPAWVAGVLGLALFANAIAFNVRDLEAAVARVGAGPALRAAQLAAAFGVGASLLAPPSVRPLGAVPLATLAAIARFRFDERYCHVVVDGALLVGALVAVIFQAE